MSTSPIRRIGVLTGGGDCPGLNAVIRAVVKSALIEQNLEEGAKPKGGEVVVRQRIETSFDPIRLGGIAGKLSADLEQITKIEARAVTLGHIQRGGTPPPPTASWAPAMDREPWTCSCPANSPNSWSGNPAISTRSPSNRSAANSAKSPPTTPSSWPPGPSGPALAIERTLLDQRQHPPLLRALKRRIHNLLPDAAHAR
jgi:hypothetical protein